MTQALTETTAELKKANDEIAELKAGHSNLLVHTVYFKVNDGISEEDKNSFKSKLKALSAIDEVKELTVGEPAATGDPRLVSNYTFVLQMGFSSEEDLAGYQENPVHLKTKEEVKPLLSAPPVVYDYWLR